MQDNFRVCEELVLFDLCIPYSGFRIPIFRFRIAPSASGFRFPVSRSGFQGFTHVNGFYLFYFAR